MLVGLAGLALCHQVFLLLRFGPKHALELAIGVADADHAVRAPAGRAGDCKCRDSRALRQKFLRPRLQGFADSLRVSGNDCEVSPSRLVGLDLALFPIPQCT